MQNVRSHRYRRGFTLVEMLVVITIIGILVALLIPTVGAVVRRAKNAAIALEIEQMAGAMDAYKQFANDYPPDFTNVAAVAAHISRAFPRNTRSVAAWWASQDKDTSTNPPRTRDVNNLDPAEAIVFWLSLLSNNPRDPLGGASWMYAGERKVIFDFDPARLVDLDGDGWNEYVPKNADQAPYVYFDGRLIGGAYAYTTASYPKGASVGAAAVRPYRSNLLIDGNRDNKRTQPANSPVVNNVTYNTTQWLKPGQFQIICAGLDNDFGTEFVQNQAVVFKTFPEPNYPLEGAEQDNLANFSQTSTFVDAVP